MNLPDLEAITDRDIPADSDIYDIISYFGGFLIHLLNNPLTGHTIATSTKVKYLSHVKEALKDKFKFKLCFQPQNMAWWLDMSHAFQQA